MDTSGLGNLFEDPSSALRGLHQRFDDLRLGGCSSRIAWGKLGCIAYISRDRLGVEVRSLKADSKDGKWALSNPAPIIQTSAAHEEAEIVHLCWNNIGTELAIVDVQGRVSIFTAYVCADRFSCVRSAAMDHEDDLGMLVGLWWLNMDKPHFMFKPAMKDKDTGHYRYPFNPIKPFGPFNPVAGKSACIGVTRSGVVKLWYNQDHSHINEVSCELENNISAENLLTHAAFTTDKDQTIVLAAMTQNKQLRTYKISVNWNIPPLEPPNKFVTHLPNAASIHSQRLEVEDFATPLSDGTHDTNRAHLIRLEILPPFPLPSGPTSIPAVVAFSVSTGAHPFTIISRWELRTEKPELHSAFDQLPTRRNSTSQEKTVYKLKRLPDQIIDKCLVSVNVLAGSTLIALGYTDGSIEIRERINLKQIMPSGAQEYIGNMTHAGFQFPRIDNFIDLALSPNNAVAATMTHNSEIFIAPVSYDQGSLEGTVETNPHIKYAAAALAQQHAYSVNNHINNDDLVMVAQKYRSNAFVGAFLTEAQRSLQLNMDLTNMAQSEKLLRNPFLQRFFSLQCSLDYVGELHTRSMRSKIAFASLHLRHSAVGFAYFMNNVARAPQNQLTEKRSVALQSLLGLIKWEIDIHTYIIDELLDVTRRARTKNTDRASDTKLVKRIVSDSNSVALALVLSSACRGLLRYNSRALTGFDRTAIEQLQTPNDEETLSCFRSVKAIIDASPIKLQFLDKMLADVDTSIRNAQKELSEQDRSTLERNLFLNPSEIPSEFDSVIEHLMTSLLPTLKNEIDPSRVFFHDNTWLGFYDDKKAIEYRKRNKIDTLKKFPLKIDGSIPVRRCVRCCESTEDLVPHKGLGIWLHSVSRVCICSSLWIHD